MELLVMTELMVMMGQELMTEQEKMMMTVTMEIVSIFQ